MLLRKDELRTWTVTIASLIKLKSLFLLVVMQLIIRMRQDVNCRQTTIIKYREICLPIYEYMINFINLSNIYKLYYKLCCKLIKTCYIILDQLLTYSAFERNVQKTFYKNFLLNKKELAFFIFKSDQINYVMCKKSLLQKYRKLI